jgi:hypothetical protein
MNAKNATSLTLPPIPAKTGPGRKRSGPVPAWGLKLGGFLTTLGVFVGSFGYASTNHYVTNAPLQPATVAEVAASDMTATATAAPSTASTTTTTLTSTVRTTTRAAVTVTKKS